MQLNNAPKHTKPAALINIIIIIIIIFSFMQGIHTHIPETNHVPREYIVAAILSLFFMLPLPLVPLCFYVSTFRTVCAVPNIYYYYYHHHHHNHHHY